MRKPRRNLKSVGRDAIESLRINLRPCFVNRVRLDLQHPLHVCRMKQGCSRIIPIKVIESPNYSIQMDGLPYSSIYAQKTFVSAKLLVEVVAVTA
jgi:hypothetical protein